MPPPGDPPDAGNPGRASGPRPLADAVPGAVSHDLYSGQSTGGPAGPPRSPGRPGSGGGLPPGRRPSGLNGPGIVLICLALLAAGLVLWPQVRARAIESRAKPLISGLAGRDAGARCPRYLTSMFGGRAGSVSLDHEGNIADRTDLTKPICDGLKRALSKEGREELSCLTEPRGFCTPEARKSVVALMVTTHEAMHLRGILDEAKAECAAITYAPKAAELAMLTPGQGRVMAWVHWKALNANTPGQYRVNEASCPAAAALVAAPPGTPDQLTMLEMTTSVTWMAVTSGR